VFGMLPLAVSGAAVVFHSAAEPLSTTDRAPRTCLPYRDREQQQIVLALVVSFLVIQLSNTTPILLMSVKSAIPGTHGMAGQCGCMPVS
jgi:hypothetical protein